MQAQVTPDPNGILMWVPPVAHIGKAATGATPTSQVDGTVDRLADQVCVSSVSGVLLDHVHEYPAQAAVLAVPGADSQPIDALTLSQHPGENSFAPSNLGSMQVAQLLRMIVSGAVPVPVGVLVPRRRCPRLVLLRAVEHVAEPVALDEGEVFEHPAKGQGGRRQSCEELAGRQPRGLTAHGGPVVIQPTAQHQDLVGHRRRVYPERLVIVHAPTLTGNWTNHGV